MGKILWKSNEIEKKFMDSAKNSVEKRMKMKFPRWCGKWLDFRFEKSSIDFKDVNIHTYMIIMIVIIIVIIATVITSQTMWLMVDMHVTVWLTVAGKCTTCHSNQTQCNLVSKINHRKCETKLISIIATNRLVEDFA